MESDTEMSLLKAIESLTQEIRAMRGDALVQGQAAEVSPKAGDLALANRESGCSGVQSGPDPQKARPVGADAAELAEIREQVGKAQEELDDLVLALGKKEHELTAAQEACQLTERSVEGLESRKREMETAVAALEGLAAQRLSMQTEVAALQVRLASMKAEENQEQAALKELLAREEASRQAIEDARRAAELLRKLWPKWLSHAGLRTWKEALERGVFAEDSPPSFCLLFAALHSYSAAMRDPDNRILLDSLRDLGRRLYQWLKDQDQSEESIAEVVGAWAEAINGECEGKCSVQVAVPGNPANTKWMNFTPKSGSSPDVASVRSWCVIDSQGRPIHRAEVIV